MSMVAIFVCNHCNQESIHGRFRGDAMYQPKFMCRVCGKETPHQFQWYSSEELVPEGIRRRSQRQS